MTKAEEHERTECILPVSLRSAIFATLPIISQFRNCINNSSSTSSFELEVRLGTYSQDMQWKTGVDARFFNSIVTLLDAYKEWESTTDWVDIHDYFYTTSSGMRVRTSTFMDPIHVVHMNKTRGQYIDLAIVGSIYSARVSLKQEVSIDASTIPTAVFPDLVRIKKRRIYALKYWKFEVTRVWSGASRIEAEMKQSSNEATYEIEIEFNGDATYVYDHSDIYIATSMLLKVCNLLSNTILTIYPAPITINNNR